MAKRLAGGCVFFCQTRDRQAERLRRLQVDVAPLFRFVLPIKSWDACQAKEGPGFRSLFGTYGRAFSLRKAAT